MNRAYNLSEWRPWEQNASPMLLTLTLNAGMRDLRDYFGMPLWTSVIIYEDNQAKWLFRPKELKLLGQKMLDFLMCPPYRVSFVTGYDNAENALLERAHEVQFVTDLGTLQDTALSALFHDYCRLYYRWYKYGWFCEPVQFQSQDMLSSFLEKELRSVQPDLDVSRATQALFTIEDDSFSLSILEHMGECAEALGEALKDDQVRREVERVNGQPGFPSAVAELVFRATGGRQDPCLKVLVGKLEEHSSRYYWKQNNYFSTRFVDAREVLVEILSLESLDLAAPDATIRAQLEQSRENKSRLLAEKGALLGLLPPYQRSIAMLASSVGGSLIDKRKRTTMVANAAFDRILGEAASRTRADIADCRLLFPQEFGEYLSSPAEYRPRFEERRKRFLVFQGDFPLLDDLFGDVATRAEREELAYDAFSMPEPFIAEGAEADKAIEQLNSRLNFLAEAQADTFEKLQGVTVYYDPAEPEMVGTARVVKDPKAQALQSGQILVAPSTTPDYMDAIRRCKAIVTDWGGQTSHAAIVSRELKKPCIIGTNYASQVLRDGHKLRLHFRQGVVELVEGPQAKGNVDQS